jgi:hypothetical protein
MFEIYDTDTKQTVAEFHTDPYQYTARRDAGAAVKDALRTVRINGQMNRTQADEPDAFEGNDGPIGNAPTSLEGYQEPRGEYVASRISQLVRPAYMVRELDEAERVEAQTVLAEAGYTEGQKVELDGQRAIVVEVRTEPFTGPDGSEHDASTDSPLFIVGTQDGAEVATESDLTSSDWSADVEDPESGLQETAEAMHASVMASLPSDVSPVYHGTLEAGPTDWDYPESWQESETPNRLILLDAWSSMGGQFDCGGGCCMGTMTSGGMSKGAAAEFCASMKDRVLLWEGWRKGG